VLAFNGTVAQLVEAWAQLFTHWLPASGKQLDARPLFEHYPVTAGYDAKAGTFECELCIPVVPL
jgi:AraC family transcriptional regulator